MKEVGGAESLFALSAELLFKRGETIGACTLATEIDSRRLCPGIPSKMFPLLTEGRAFGFVGGAKLPVGVDIVLFVRRSSAARDMRGAMVGAAVEATWIVLERLWPGTSRKACFVSSFVGITRGPFSPVGVTGSPARNAADFVVRGVISGVRCVFGTGRALKGTFPFDEVTALRSEELLEVKDVSFLEPELVRRADS